MKTTEIILIIYSILITCLFFSFYFKNKYLRNRLRAFSDENVKLLEELKKYNHIHLDKLYINPQDLQSYLGNMLHHIGECIKGEFNYNKDNKPETPRTFDIHASTFEQGQALSMIGLYLTHYSHDSKERKEEIISIIKDQFIFNDHHSINVDFLLSLASDLLCWNWQERISKLK